MEKVKFTLTTMARTVLMAFAFLSFSYGLHAQSTYPTPDVTDPTVCDSADVVTVKLTDNGCDAPEEVFLEFKAGGTDDPSAFTGHSWQIAFKSGKNGSYSTKALTENDLVNVYGGSKTGNSFKVTLGIEAFTEKSGGDSKALTSWAADTLNFFVFQICDDDAGIAPPADSVAPADRKELTTGTFSASAPGGLIENKTSTTETMVYWGNNFGDVDSICSTTTNSSGDIMIDAIMGETDTLWSLYNDAKLDSQIVRVCMLGSELVHTNENYELEVYNNTNTLLNDGDGYDPVGPGDSIVVKSLGKNSDYCWDVKFYFDGDGTNDFLGTDENAGTNYIYVKAKKLDCEIIDEVTISNVTTTSFTASWVVNQGTSGHTFKAYLYQGDTLGGTLGNSRPDTSSTFIETWEWLANDPNIKVTHDTVYSYTVEGLNPCNSYQFWVTNICDGMAGAPNGTWAGGETKTFLSTPMATAVGIDSICTSNGGGVTVSVKGGPCFAKEVGFIIVDAAGVGKDTAWFLSHDAANDSVEVSAKDFVVTYELTDSLGAGDYKAYVTVQDSAEAGIWRDTLPFKVELKDTLNPTARIWLDESETGPGWAVSAAGTITALGSTGTGTVSGGVLLGTFTPQAGACGVDIDLIMDVDDECAASGAVTVTIVDAVNASGKVYPGAADSGRVAVMSLGAGDFSFKVSLSDGTNTNTVAFSGTVVDNVKPVVSTPGNVTVQIGECATTGTAYFNLNATDNCADAVDVTSGVSITSKPDGADLAGITHVSNGMWKAEGLVAGTYTVTIAANAVNDGNGNGNAETTFDFVVEAGDTPVAPQIVGPGNINAIIPVCDTDTKVSFALAVIDECNENPTLTVTGATKEGDFYTVTVEDGDEITVTAKSAGAEDYSFTITGTAAMEDQAPDITMPGNLTFTLPDCEISETVVLSVFVDDDCTSLEDLYAKTEITLTSEGEEVDLDLSPNYDNGQLQILVTFDVTRDMNGALLEVDVYGSNPLLPAISTAFSLLTVNGEVAADNFVCEDDLNVTLEDDGCYKEIPASMVLKGNNGGTVCNALYDVIVEKLDSDGKFVGYTENEVVTGDRGIGPNNKRRYMVFPARDDWDLEATSTDFVNTNNMVCWGYLTIEDKRRPEFEVCPPNTEEATRAEAYYTWTTTLGSSTFQPSIFSCYQSTTPTTPPGAPVFTPYTAINEPHHYSTFTFAPAVSGKYTITVTSADFDASMALFQQDGSVVLTGTARDAYHRSDAANRYGAGWFDVNEPCSNIVAFGESVIDASEYGGFGNEDQSTPSWELDDTKPQQRISLPLNGDREYTLLVTSRAASETGSFTVEFERDGADATTEAAYLLSQKTATTRVEPDFLDASVNTAAKATAILKYWNVTEDDWDNASSSWKNYDSKGRLDNRTLYCDDINSVLITPANFGLTQKFDYENCYTVDANSTVVSGLHPELQKRLFYTGYPTVTDNCGDITVCVSDIVTKLGDCDQQFITRTFTAVDVNGNVADPICEQRINFAVPQIGDLSFPHYTQYVECDDAGDLGATLVDANGHPSPAVTGYPFMQSAFGYHDLAPEWCNLAASYSDEAKIPGCENSYKLRREWTILDWCRPGTSVVYNQLIKVGDFTAPTMSADVASLAANNRGLKVNGSKITYSTSPFDCTASFAIPYPYPVDNCSAWIDVDVEVQEEVTVSIKDHFGNEVGTRKEWQTIREGRFTSPSSLSVSGIASYRTYQFVYTAVDGCGNESQEMYIGFEVKDLIEPVSVCDDQITVTLGGGSFDLDNTSATTSSGYARLYKQDLGEGEMWDNCGVADYHVRRKGDTAWGEYVGFTCADVGTPVEVELEVIDINGNKSLCWLNVVVEDKTRPYCVAPVDVTDDCTTIPADFNPPATLAAYTAMSDAAKAALHAQLDELFGAAEILDNCNSVTVSQAVTKIDWHCNSGTITRSFSGVDGYGNTTVAGCTQSITITREHDYSFTLPKDESVATCATAYDVFDINPVVTGCDLISVYTTDKQFEASGDECYKLFRTFEVVNWCQFTGNDLSVADPFLIKRDWVDGTGANVGKVANNFVVTYTEVLENNVMTDHILVGKSAGNDDYYNANASVVDATGAGYYQYTQIIAVYDNVAPTVSATVEADYCTFNCDATTTVVVAIAVSDDCTPTDITVTAHVVAETGAIIPATVNATHTEVTTPGLPVGNHTLVVTAVDGCGNSNKVEEPLVIVDCKGPGITCLSGINVELMPVDDNGDGSIDGGAMTVFAKDYVSIFDQDPCDPAKYFTIHEVTPELEAELAAHEAKPANERSRTLSDVLDSDTANESMVVTCADIPLTTVVIAAWDANGNGDYCMTFIMVQDNMNLCGGAAGPSVAGLISTETNNTVENVDVNLSGQMTDNMLTTTDGNYVFVNLQSGYDYTITPLLDDDHDNGVTTFDLIEIGKHILTVKPLGSPYKMIAADVDNNRSITTLDLIQLRRLILSVDTEFANNTSWRFVDASYQFPNPSNPWAASFPEIININDLDGSELSGDFVAIKVGDVTLDAKANSLMTSGRSVAGQFNLDVADVAMKAGGEYTVAFNASNLSDIQGYQFTLNLDASVELVDINYGVAVEENFGTRFVSEGAITTSWNQSAGAQTQNVASSLFELVLRAKADVQLSEVVDVTSRYTVAEAYNNNGQLLDVAINFNNGATASSVELYQNTPNPFKGETVVGFNLPEAASATLTITDVTGKVLRVVRGEYARGYNQVNLNSAQLPATGVLYYTLETGDFTATKKMVIVE